MKANKSFRSAAVVALALGAQSLAFAGQKDAIVGGETVRAGDAVASSTVLIFGQLSATKQYICSGSLISADTIVTAAHCVAEDINAPTPPSKITLIFGLSIPQSQAQADKTPMTHPTNYVYNPGWKGATGKGGEKGNDPHDIAVIHFEGNLPAGFAPATLLDPSVRLIGKTATLAGYGISEPGAAKTGNAGAGILRKISGVPIVQAFGPSEVVLDETQGGGCSGDSGGPAFLSIKGENYLWGVAEAVTSANCDQGIIYTRIAAYTDFVTQAESSLRRQKAFSSAVDSGRASQSRAAERYQSYAGGISEALSAN